MIIFGTKKKHTHTVRIANKKCNSCNQITTHIVKFYSKAIHIFWIPMFPYQKKVTSSCYCCKKIISEKKQRDNGLQLAIENAKRNVKFPKIHFLGVFLIVCLIPLLFYVRKQHIKNRELYINSPKINDVVTYRLGSGYSTLKIVKVTKDSVCFTANSLWTDNFGKIYKINKPKNYGVKKTGVSLTEYRHKFTKKEYIDVKR